MQEHETPQWTWCLWDAYVTAMWSVLRITMKEIANWPCNSFKKHCQRTCSLSKNPKQMVKEYDNILPIFREEDVSLRSSRDIQTTVERNKEWEHDAVLIDVARIKCVRVCVRVCACVCAVWLWCKAEAEALGADCVATSIYHHHAAVTKAWVRISHTKNKENGSWCRLPHNEKSCLWLSFADLWMYDCW